MEKKHEVERLSSKEAQAVNKANNKEFRKKASARPLLVNLMERKLEKLRNLSHPISIKKAYGN